MCVQLLKTLSLSLEQFEVAGSEKKGAINRIEECSESV